MAQLYHWPVPCSICESPVEYHCNTCGGRNHNVVPYSQRIETNKASLKCGDHPGHQCGVWCRTCNKAVCNECLISPNHTGHLFLKFDEKIGERRKEIQDQFEKYSKLISEWQTSLQQSEKLKETYEEDIQHLDREIVGRAEEICRQVRVVESDCRKQLQEMKDASIRVLHDHQRTLSDGIQRLKKKIKELEDMLRSNDTSTILQCTVEEESIADIKPSLDNFPVVPVFTSGTLDNEVLKKRFGSVSDSTLVVSTLKSSQLQPTLLPEPSVEVISVEKTDAPRIACMELGQAWIQTDGNQKAQLFDRKGTIKKTVNIRFYTGDIAKPPQGNAFLTDINSKCIKSISITGDIKKVFSTKWKPHGLCCLPNGNIIVTFRKDRRVVQYTSTGRIIREMDESLFEYPWYVAHSQVNHQFYICDRSAESALVVKGRILAFDMYAQLQYTYNGQGLHAEFTPAGVSTDILGNVLITDWGNNRVHILDKGGNFLRYLLTKEQGLKKPTTIDVDSDGYAWIGEWFTGKLKVVKYMERK